MNVLKQAQSENIRMETKAKAFARFGPRTHRNSKVLDEALKEMQKGVAFKIMSVRQSY